MGADGVTTAATAATAGEYVSPSDYPTDEVLAEMVDAYEALICWFYALPGSGGVDNDDGSGGGSDTTTGRGGTGRTGKQDGSGKRHDGESGGISCFVAYHDEGKRRRPSATNTAFGNDEPKGEQGSKIAELEEKRAAIAARARDRQREEEGDNQGSGSSATSNSGDNAAAVREQELDTLDFEPGALRVRVILASRGTTELLRKATGVFLSAARNRNPVRRISPTTTFITYQGLKKKGHSCTLSKNSRLTAAGPTRQGPRSTQRIRIFISRPIPQQSKGVHFFAQHFSDGLVSSKVSNYRLLNVCEHDVFATTAVVYFFS